MSENYKRAKDKRHKILDEAKEKVVREWLFTKRNFDQEKANFDRLHQNWQAACELVTTTKKELEDTRDEYEYLKRFYGVVEDSPLPPSSSANSSPAPLPRIRHATPSPTANANPNSHSPTWHRER